MYTNKDWLLQKYITEQLSTSQIADLLEVSNVTIQNWLRKHDIELRSQADSLKIRYKNGSLNNPNLGKKSSKETREKISKNHADVSGTNNPMFGKSGPLSPNFGKIRSKEHCLKLSKALTGRKRPNVSKEKNPFWKGGITPLVLQIRNSVQGKTWRQQVFERDNFICKACGYTKGKVLNAHHIKHLAVILHEYEIKTFDEALKCDILWNPINGITLCKECHVYEHEKHL